ncbi:MAG TPA: class I tRNA ligase family protein, partial [Acidimicrobiales bacterium]|nr:class I tRNA ligase family protein [Acidimicrobiales bacterium]
DWTDQTDDVIEGMGRFLDRVWRVAVPDPASPGRHLDPVPVRQGARTPADMEMERATHRLIAKVSGDIERWSFNTSVAECMKFLNTLQAYRRDTAGGPHEETDTAAVDALLLVLAPMAPHVTAELWERRRGKGARIHSEAWPAFDPELAKAETVIMVVQIDGKVRDRMEVDAEITEDEARHLALYSPKVVQALNGSEPANVIVRPPRLVNVVRAVHPA